MQGTCLIRSLGCLLAVLLVGAPTAAAQERNCFWTVKEEPNAANVAYPDEGANYWGAGVELPPGGELVLRGRYPHARYMSFHVYDEILRPTDALSDLETGADPGSANPFIAGARRDGGQRGYTIRVVAGAPPPPAEREPNTIYMNISGQASPVGSMIYRTYVPDEGLGEDGGVGLPSVSLRLANGTELDQPATCEALEAVPLPPTANEAYAQSDGVTPEGVAAEGRDPPVWRAFFNFFATVASRGERQTGPLPASEAVIERDERSGGFYSNVHNAYASSAVSRGFGPVLVLEGTAPTFPRTRDGRPMMGSGQVRYWSLCQNETNSTRFVDCMYDEDVLTGAGRRYTIAVSSPGFRPDNAHKRCGVNWLAWGASPEGALIMRHMLPSADFAQAIQNVSHPDRTEEQTGEYLPRGRYMSRADFEALGCDGAGAGSPSGGRLHMSVSPYRPRSGRQVRVRFRVWSRGRAVQGARVRFAGRNARTGSRGRASIVKKRLRPGRYVASARKRGMQADRDRVRVRR